MNSSDCIDRALRACTLSVCLLVIGTALLLLSAIAFTWGRPPAVELAIESLPLPTWVGVVAAVLGLVAVAGALAAGLHELALVRQSEVLDARSDVTS